jgi:hypothetical protein
VGCYEDEGADVWSRGEVRRRLTKPHGDWMVRDTSQVISRRDSWVPVAPHDRRTTSRRLLGQQRPVSDPIDVPPELVVGVSLRGAGGS